MDAIVERFEVLDHLRGLGARSGFGHHGSQAKPWLGVNVLDPDPLQREGPAEVAFVGDLGDEAEARQPRHYGAVQLPAPLFVNSAAAWELSAVVSRWERLVVSAFSVCGLSRSGFWLSNTARSPNLALC